METQTQENKIDEWKQRLERLNLQLHLGKMEAENEFEKQKVSFREWLIDARVRLSQLQHISDEQREKLHHLLDELQNEASVAKDTTREALNKNGQRLASGIEEMSAKFAELEENSEENISDFIKRNGEILDEFHTSFDLFRLQFHLGKEDTKDLLEEKRNELKEKIHELNVKLDKQANQVEENWESFTSEMSAYSSGLSG